MSADKTVREYFGWSQETLAFYLGVSRSLLKLVEKGERSLPSAAYIRLLDLELFALGKDKTGTPLSSVEAIAPAKEDNKKLLRQERRYKLLAENTRLQLEKVQQRYQQAQNSLALHRHLHPGVDAATDEKGKGDQIWLGLIEAKAIMHLRRFGPAAQAVLQWKIDCYEFAAKRAKELGK